MDQLQRSSGARLQLSRAGEFFPGTSERVLLLSGTLHSVLTSIFLILEKLAADARVAPSRGRPSTAGASRNGPSASGPKPEENQVHSPTGYHSARPYPAMRPSLWLLPPHGLPACAPALLTPALFHLSSSQHMPACHARLWQCLSRCS